MIRIAIYGRAFNDNVLSHVQEVFSQIQELAIQPVIFHEFHTLIKEKIVLPEASEVFYDHQDLKAKADIMLCLGGDGTLLDTLSYVRNSGIPIIGINFGRLGFLASINKDEIASALQAIVKNEYVLDTRTLLNLESEDDLFNGENFALNDITIHRRDTSAMMIIHAFMNGEFVNSYWADGLIIASPTGSTAYSLSCGGPIIYPTAKNFVITPIAPHNLNVRPIIVPDENLLSFKIEARDSRFLLTCDSRTVSVDGGVTIGIKKADFGINLIRLNNESYLNTLRNKLLWGLDTRNY